MTLDEIAEEYELAHSPMLRMDGFDDCVIGVVQCYGMDPVLCYDKDKVLAKMVKDGMTGEEAEEFFEFNQIGAWMGIGTPCFLVEKVDDEGT